MHFFSRCLNLVTTSFLLPSDLVPLFYATWSGVLEAGRNFRKCLGELNGVRVGAGKVQGISSLNMTSGSLSPFRASVACFPSSLLLLDLCSSKSWDDPFMVSVSDLESGNYCSWFYFSCVFRELHFPTWGPLCIIGDPQSTLHSNFEILITFITTCLGSVFPCWT